ncbi:hypothetical protein HQ393_04625 [Chitinibacter bivalviorum]|uniref:Uncharacterized protein n=1 Tax=Chitinibacter bivalviorum TaxID=2739434 RepID=A0A7H9BH64_9NEIS|nr:hypothetical protein [Chitinibacter bivalviorum]QLG87596.1 hypothetical protein HQ393_04625 [Chitinibacter bivalviorum]
MQTITNIFTDANPWFLGCFGYSFQLLDTSAPVDITLTRGNSPVAKARGVQSGFKLRQQKPFDGVIIENAGIGSSVTIFVGSEVDAEYTRIAGLVDTRIKSAKTLLNKPMLNVAQNTETLLCAANDGRARLIVWNNGTADVYIGAPGLAIADAAIKLAAGDQWIEETAAACAWIVIHNNAAAQAIKVQEALY